MGPALSLDRSWPHDRSNADGPPSQHDGITLLTVIVYVHARVGSVVVFNSLLAKCEGGTMRSGSFSIFATTGQRP
jgi:hypothetical protein